MWLTVTFDTNWSSPANPPNFEEKTNHARCLTDPNSFRRGHTTDNARVSSKVCDWLRRPISCYPDSICQLERTSDERFPLLYFFSTSITRLATSRQCNAPVRRDPITHQLGPKAADTPALPHTLHRSRPGGESDVHATVRSGRRLI